MSIQVYRGNLSAKFFPYLSTQFGRSIIVAGPDQNFNRQVVSAADTDKDVGIPQIYFAQNVMPTGQGFNSVGYDLKTFGPGDRGTYESAVLVRDGAGNKGYLARNNSNLHFWYFDLGTNQWYDLGIPTVHGTTVTAFYYSPTTAYVGGTSYLYLPLFYCFKIDLVARALVPQPLTGLDVTSIIGIVASAGYLVAYSVNAVAWSSTIDPTDFTPSLTTGAGGGNVEGLKGSIVACIVHALGFIVYSTGNAVGALYSGNARYPFQFREIVGTGGLESSELVVSDANTTNHYAYTSSGLQSVSMQQAQTVYPELTDFMAQGMMEDWDFVNSIMSYQQSPGTGGFQAKKLTMVADRYFVVSYGVYVDNLTHAVVYDVILNRWGKLKFAHSDCFEWVNTPAPGADPAKHSLAFMDSAGNISTANVQHQECEGVIFLGKYQLQRSRLMQLETVELEDVDHDKNTDVLLLTSLDGKNTTSSSPTSTTIHRDIRKYTFHKTGVNHTVVVLGNFKLNTIILSLTNQGRR